MKRNRNDVTFVKNVIDLYDRLSLSYERLNPSDRSKIDNNAIKFPGFDPITESEQLSIVVEILADRALFSHVSREESYEADRPMSWLYAVMLAQLENFDQKLHFGGVLTIDEIDWFIP